MSPLCACHIPKVIDPIATSKEYKFQRLTFLNEANEVKVPASRVKNPNEYRIVDFATPAAARTWPSPAAWPPPPGPPFPPPAPFAPAPLPPPEGGGVEPGFGVGEGLAFGQFGQSTFAIFVFRLFWTVAFALQFPVFTPVFPPVLLLALLPPVSQLTFTLLFKVALLFWLMVVLLCWFTVTLFEPLFP